MANDDDELSEKLQVNDANDADADADADEQGNNDEESLRQKNMVAT
jgi:hypothetical protein